VLSQVSIDRCTAISSQLADSAALAELVRCDVGDAEEHNVELSVAATLRKCGHELRLIYAVPDACPAGRDDRLIQLLANGRAAYDALCRGQDDAESRRQLIRLARLSFLAPDIVAAILDGRQPIELTSRALLRIADLPLAWDRQRTALGFA
jgi:hypothetical protein